jgi:hypothetical protein
MYMFKRWSNTVLAVFITLLPWQGHLAAWCVNETQMACCTAPGDCSMAGMASEETERNGPEFCECETSRTGIPSVLPAQSVFSPLNCSSVSLIPGSTTWDHPTRVGSCRMPDHIRDRSGTYIKQHSFRI